jgi:hypothetical protein
MKKPTQREKPMQLRPTIVKALIAVTAAVPMGATAGAASATAAPIRECGNAPRLHAYNITTRLVSCREARSVIRRWNRTNARRVGVFRCRYRSIGYEAGDVRCVQRAAHGTAVVRWQTYS